MQLIEDNEHGIPMIKYVYFLITFYLVSSHSTLFSSGFYHVQSNIFLIYLSAKSDVLTIPILFLSSILELRHQI